MDRTPEHLKEDPILRSDFITQPSWDEWAAVNAPFFLHPNAREIVESQMRDMGMKAAYEDALAVANEQWSSTLHPETNVDEVLYLSGYSHIERQQIIDQRHATLLRRAIEVGLIPERQTDADFREQFGQ